MITKLAQVSHAYKKKKGFIINQQAYLSEKTFIDSRMSRRELWAKEKQQMRECLPHDKKIILDILSILI